MTLPRIPAFPETIDAAAVDQFTENCFVQFGSVIADADLIDMRFAYERVLDHGPYLDERRGFTSTTDRRAIWVSGFCEEEALMRQAANPGLMRIAAALLGTGDIIYSDGYMMAQRLVCQRTLGDDEGWHTDFDARRVTEPIRHVNLWVYLDEVAVANGPTQVVQGAAPRMRKNLAAGREVSDGIEALRRDPDHALYMEGPAGGGFAFSGVTWHRATVNSCGQPRRVVTYEYDVRCDRPHGRFYDVTSKAQQQRVAGMLPPAQRSLILS